MDNKTKGNVDILTIIIMIIVALITIIDNSENAVEISILSLILISSFMFRNLILYKNERYFKFKPASIFFDLIIIAMIFFQDQTNTSQIYLIIVIIDSVFSYSFKFSLLTASISYMISSWKNFNHHKYQFDSMETFFLTFILNILSFGFVFLFVYLFKEQIHQKKIIRETMEELEYKNIKLKELFKELEEVALIKERNKIAHEIHDTVGHTLTNVLLGIEASKRLMEVDQEKAKEKLSASQEYVKRGLDDIRGAVRLIKSEEDKIDLERAIMNIIFHSQDYAGITINYSISVDDDMPVEYKKILVRALQEGLTNGIKHGNSSCFNFTLAQENNIIKFILKDNGSGGDNIKLGFGLQSMKDRVEELKGFFKISSQKDEGFEITIEFKVRGEGFGRE